MESRFYILLPMGQMRGDFISRPDGDPFFINYQNGTDEEVTL